MAYAYSDLLAQAQHWAQAALTEQRLHKASAQALLDIDKRSPDSLFRELGLAAATRPLIVAFMGGTGVGKSSLLNRLAGQAIAKVGVQRPTSREVTLYHHQSLAIQHFPSDLPLHSVQISQHNRDEHSHIVWMDMPDFDSIELANQQLVMQWLPHIEVLIYVVSPERYRDNKSWQLLLAEGVKHAWLFVMNQWDRGVALQFDDFKQQLHKAGFADPLVLRSSCTESEGDEFMLLLEQLQELSGQHSRAQLEQHNQQFRMQQLQQVLQALSAKFAAMDFKQLEAFYTEVWQKTANQLQQGLAWSLLHISKQWVEQPGQNAEVKLWDDWAQSRFNDVLDDLLFQAAALQIPSKPLKTSLQTLKDQAEKTVNQQTALAGRQGLMQPGNALQRFFLKAMAVSETVLPLLAMIVVGYQVYTAFYQGATDHQAYLGVDFAVHSSMLIGLSWLMPFFLHKKLQPSLQKAALKGLQKGQLLAFAALDAQIKAVLQEENQRFRVLQQQLAELLGKCDSVVVQRAENQGLLARVLVER